MSDSSVLMAANYMGEISPGQEAGRGIFRVCRLPGIPWDITRMSSAPNINALRDAILREMEAKGFSKRKLSISAGLSESAVRDLLTRTDNPGIGTLHKIAEALEVPIESINGTEGVPMMGEIGAGGAIAYIQDSLQFETVPRPPLAPARLMALRVSGDSMLPKFDPGDVVYVRRDHDGVLRDYFGRYCAVHTSDGGTYLKILSAGTQADRYTLRSLNAADMENMEVIWASPVLFVMPQH